MLHNNNYYNVIVKHPAFEFLDLIDVVILNRHQPVKDLASSGHSFSLRTQYPSRTYVRSG
jgi:hypothetical protein